MINPLLFLSRLFDKKEATKSVVEVTQPKRVVSVTKPVTKEFYNGFRAERSGKDRMANPHLYPTSVQPALGEWDEGWCLSLSAGNNITDIFEVDGAALFLNEDDAEKWRQEDFVSGVMQEAADTLKTNHHLYEASLVEQLMADISKHNKFHN